MKLLGKPLDKIQICRKLLIRQENRWLVWIVAAIILLTYFMKRFDT